jgi:hypothetical protein
VYNQICELFFYGCSFDYNFKIADVRFVVNFTDCHLEFSYQAGMTYLISVGPDDGSTFVMKGGRIIPVGGAPTQAFINVLTTANRGGGALFDGVNMVGLGQTLNFYFADGPGRIAVNNGFGGDNFTCPYLLSASSNLLSDPNFVQFGTLPDAFIVNDTAPITNRLIGTNIQLAQVTVGGTNYLQATRGATTGAATASFALVAPIKGKNARAGFKILVKSATSPAPTGTINIFFGYCTLIPISGSVTVPQFGNGVFPQLATITPNAASFMTEGTGQFTAPAYATHAVILVQMGNWGGNGDQLYFSAPEITEM